MSVGQSVGRVGSGRSMCYSISPSWSCNFMVPTPQLPRSTGTQTPHSTTPYPTPPDIWKILFLLELPFATCILIQSLPAHCNCSFFGQALSPAWNSSFLLRLITVSALISVHAVHIRRLHPMPTSSLSHLGMDNDKISPISMFAASVWEMKDNNS